jgi:3-methylcrotonyl-CoA carboxylase alpha subunit
MDLELRLAGRTLRVRLSTADGGVDATLDGVPHRLATLASGGRVAAAGGATVEELAVEIDGRARRALVVRVRDRVLVTLDGRVYAFETGEAARDGAHAGAGSGVVIAPMPGKVIAVLVAAGDAVESGQPLVVVEAMKMESTLTAEIAGTVRAVAVAPGQVVDAGQVLVEIEPAASS